MDIEYGCYVSNRYHDFLNVSENESCVNRDGIIANGKQKNKSKQRKKKNAKHIREHSNGKTNTNALENGEVVVGTVNGTAEKPLDITIDLPKETSSELENSAQQSETTEQVTSNVPIVNENSGKIVSNEVKWSQICIEEDKAIAERNKMISENGEKRVYATIVYYNSKFGNGNCYVRLGDEFRSNRRRNKMEKVPQNVHLASEKSESEQTDSINDCNNNDMDGMKNGKLEQGNVPMKRKRTKKKKGNRAAQPTNNNRVPEQIIECDTATNGDVDKIGERKITVHNRRNNKFQRIHKSNLAVKQNNEQVNDQPNINDETLQESENAAIVNDTSHASSQNNNNNSQAAEPDNHIQTAIPFKNTENTIKPKRSHFRRRKQNVAEKIE